MTPSIAKWIPRTTHVRRPASRLRRGRKPEVEPLEGRRLMATKIWDGGGVASDTNWSNRFNWVGNVAPVPGDDLVFPELTISDLGDLEKLEPVNDFAAGTSFSSIQFGSEASGYLVGGNRITLGPGGIVDTSGGINDLNLDITISGNRTITTDGGLDVNGRISGTGDVIKSGPGTLGFAGSLSNTFAGTTRVNEGLLVLAKPAGVNAVPGALVVGDGVGNDRVRLASNNLIPDTAPVTVGSGSVLDLNGRSDAIGSLALTGGTVQTGAGTLTLGGNLTTNAAAVSASISGNLSLGGASRTFTIADGSPVSDLIVSANLSGALGAGVTKLGAGRLLLSGDNTLFTGPMSVGAGFVRINRGTALGIAGSGGTTVQAGATLEPVGSITAEEVLTLNGIGVGGLGALHVPAGGGSITFTRAVTLGAGGARVRSDDPLTFSGVVGGPGGLEKLGADPLILGGANTYGGATTVGQGALRISHGSALGAPGAATSVGTGTALEVLGNIISGERLFLGGTGINNTGALRSLSGSNTLSGAITLASDTIVGVESSTLTLSGVIDGAGGLTKVGGGTLILSGSDRNTYAGPTVVGLSTGGGTLTLSKSPGVDAVPGELRIGFFGRVSTTQAQQIPDTAPIFMDAHATLQTFADETIGPLTMIGGFLNPVQALTLNGDVVVDPGPQGGAQWIGNVSLGDATRTIAVAAGMFLEHRSGALSGGLSSTGFIKAGGGLLTLEGTNTLTGPSRVDAGTLRSVRDFPADLSVGPAGTLIGFGPYAAIVMDGALNPGDSPGFGLGGERSGVLSSGGAVAFRPTGTFHVDLDGTTPGSEHDQLRITGSGSVDLGGARLEASLGFASDVGDVFTIVRNDTSTPTLGRFTRPDGTTIEQGDVVVIGGQQFRINYSGGDFNDVILTHINSGSAFRDRSVTAAIDEGGVVTLTGTIVEPDPLDTFTLEVDWGDGTSEDFTFPPGTPRTVVLTHRYLDDPSGAADTYAIDLFWHDQHGAGNPGTLTTTVANVAPTVEAGRDERLGRSGVLNRSGRVADPGDDAIVVWVDYGDGSGPQELKVGPRGKIHLHHKYRSPGTYVVTVTALDDDGGVGAARFEVVVA